MKLAEALTRLRNLKSKISRVEGFINQSVTFWENNQPEYVYADELSKRVQLIHEISKLKTAIQITNASTKCTFENEEFYIAELILRNADIRAELAFIQGLLNQSVDTVSIYERRTKEDLKKVYAPGYDKIALRAQYDLLEQVKENLEGTLNEVNLKTDLVTI